MIHRPKRKEKKTQRSQRLIVRSLNPSSSTNQGVLSSLFSRPDVTTVLHFAVIVYVNVQLHGCYVQRQCGNLLKWRRGRKCEHGTMAGYEDAMSNIFASLFLFLPSDSRKTSDCLKFSWLPSFEQYQDVPCRSKNAESTISGLRWSPKHFVITLLP